MLYEVITPPAARRKEPMAATSAFPAENDSAILPSPPLDRAAICDG